MKPTKFEDGIIEVIDPKEVVTSECPIKVGCERPSDVPGKKSNLEVAD